MWNNATQARRPVRLVDGFRPSGRVTARRGAALQKTNSRGGQRDTSFDHGMIGDTHRVPVESLDRAGMENSRSGFVSSIPCTSRRRARAYEERCETSFGDYTLTDRVEQAEWLRCHFGATRGRVSMSAR